MNKISEKTLQSEERMAVCLKCMPKTRMMILRENSVKVTIHEWHSYGLTLNFQSGVNLQPGFKCQENFNIFRYFPVIL